MCTLFLLVPCPCTVSSFSPLLRWLHVSSPKGGPRTPPYLFPQQPPPRDSIYRGFKGRPFPREVVQIPDAVHAWCANAPSVLKLQMLPLSGGCTVRCVCKKSAGSHGSQGPEFCTPCCFEVIMHASVGGWFSGVFPG